MPLPNVESSILEKVIDWCQKHKDDPIPKEEDLNEDSVDKIEKWDEDFFKVDEKLVCDLILAANYLDIKGLMNLGCMIVAKNIRGKKTAEEIRKEFNIKNDLTPEEEEETRKENAWIMEN